jgi:hypothetical protein
MLPRAISARSRTSLELVLCGRIGRSVRAALLRVPPPEPDTEGIRRLASVVEERGLAAVCFTR